MKLYSKVMALFAAIFAIILLAPMASAECGTLGRDAVYKTVTTPAVPAVTEDVVVVVTPEIPGTPAVYEDVKVVDQEYVPATPDTPPVEEVSHMETVLVTPGIPEVAEVSHEECTTQYHFRKYTQTREGTKVKGVIVWGDYGPWTAWTPETHTSWENSNDPLGSPAPHASGKNGNVYWERVWQARFDGQTRPVDCHKVIDQEYVPATPPVYEEVKVIDQEYVPGIPGAPEVPEVSHMESQLVTPEVPPVPAETKTETVVVKDEVPASSKKVLVQSAVAATEKCTEPVLLAQTGSNAGGPLGLGLGLLLIGGLMVSVSRRFNAGK